MCPKTLATLSGRDAALNDAALIEIRAPRRAMFLLGGRSVLSDVGESEQTREFFGSPKPACRKG